MMMMIGQRLFTGRVAVAQGALQYTRQLFEMTRGYSDRKACWGPKGNTTLTTIPQLSHLYNQSVPKLDRVDAFVAECQKRLSVCLQQDVVPPIELQDAIACAKIAASETCIDLCFRLKQEVGSYACMGGTGFENMDFLQMCKFAEGDSRILMQKLARDRVKSSKALGAPAEQALASELQQAVKQGQQAWDANFGKVFDLAWLVVNRVVDGYVPGDALSVPIGLSRL